MPLNDRPERSGEYCKESPINAFDAISPRPRLSSRRNPLLLLCLLAPAVVIWLNWSSVTTHIRHVPAIPLAEGVPAPTDASPVQRSVLPRTQPGLPEARAQTQTLSECLGDTKDITEDVLRCRFGEVPRPRAQDEPRRGMVSAEYLASYKVEQAALRATGDVAQNAVSESHWIKGWDGKGGYRATWKVEGNAINSSSVCLNHGRGSIEYRECRKGAKQWFKDQCRAAGDGSGAAKRRYCLAASSFSPMG